MLNAYVVGENEALRFISATLIVLSERGGGGESFTKTYEIVIVTTQLGYAVAELTFALPIAPFLVW